jgi:hypothetical protein
MAGFEVFTPVTVYYFSATKLSWFMKNTFFWDMKTQFEPHRRHKLLRYSV